MTLRDASGKFVRTAKADLGLDGILPGQPLDRFFSSSLSGLSSGKYTVLIGCPNPLVNGAPVGFANESYAKDAKGWLTVGSINL
jgi:hypothetical protein